MTRAALVLTLFYLLAVRGSFHPVPSLDVFSDDMT